MYRPQSHPPTPGTKQYKIFYKILLLGLSLFYSTANWSLSTDKEKNIEIESDSAEFDNTTGTITYQGNVSVSQGSIHIKGEYLTVQLKDEEIQNLTIQGKPSTFRQLPNDSDIHDDAQATTIKYDQAKDLVILIGNASVNQEQLHLQSEYIEYNTELNTIKLNNKNNTTNADEPSKKRVKIIYKPKTKNAN